MMDLKDKVAIVTGASSGIGAEIVKALLKIGMKVVGFARRKEKVENLVKNHEGKLFALSIDVTNFKQFIEGFAWVTKNIGPIHVLINNAGMGIQGSIINGDLESWQKGLDTNFMSVAVACKEAIKIMKENNIDGHIININSTYGYYEPFNFNSVMYRTSKLALTAMTENIRTELASLGSKIKITTVAPGVVKTKFFEAAGLKNEESENFYKNLPYLQGEDIANTVVYLLSTPPHVHLSEVIIRPTGEHMLDVNKI